MLSRPFLAAGAGRAMGGRESTAAAGNPTRPEPWHGGRTRRDRCGRAPGKVQMAPARAALPAAGSLPVPSRSRPLMLAKLNTFALVGIEGMPVEVEVDASPGLPKTILVGL